MTNQIQNPNDESERCRIGPLMTERRLAESMELDRLSTMDALAVMNEQDAMAVKAVESQRAEDGAGRGDGWRWRSMSEGQADLRGGGNQREAGRAGCRRNVAPTFGTDPKLVQGVIAGGE